MYLFSSSLSFQSFNYVLKINIIDWKFYETVIFFVHSLSEKEIKLK